MKHVRAAFALLLAVLPGTALAQKAETGSIRYVFQTLMIVDPVQAMSATVLKVDPWFMGGAVPTRAVTLDADVAIPGTGVTFTKGTVLSVADSAYLIACSDKAAVTNGLLGMGKAPICLIDLDQDGTLDAWYKSSIPMMWNHWPGHIQRDDIHPVTPVKTTPLSADEVRKLPSWSAFSVQYAQGMLTYCLYMQVCLQRQPRIKPSDVEQTTELMGGAFAYRKTDEKHLAVRMISVPKEEVF